VTPRSIGLWKPVPSHKANHRRRRPFNGLLGRFTGLSKRPETSIWTVPVYAPHPFARWLVSITAAVIGGVSGLVATSVWLRHHTRTVLRRHLSRAASANAYAPTEMQVASAAASVLLFSGLFAGILVFAPLVGLAHHPRGSLAVCLLAATLAASVVAVHVGVPLSQRVPAFAWDGIATDYFLAMAHRLNGAPYPFFWSSPWVYQVGGLTWLIPVGGVLAVATAYPAHRAAQRLAPVLMVIGSLVVLAYVAAAVYASMATWYGIGL